jgi:hypothetical protein
MRINKTLRTAICCLAIPGMLLPAGPATAAEQVDPTTENYAPGAPAAQRARTFKIVDVSLGQNGLLSGVVSDRRGRGVANATVTVVHEATQVSQVTTDQRGSFHVDGLKGGVYQLATENGIQACRLWHRQTAPPSANEVVQVIVDGDIVAGQFAPLKCWLSSPLVVAGIAAIAIAVPVAISNGRNSNRSAPGS